MIMAEVAVYPLKTNDSTKVIKDSIKAINGNDVEYTVNSINTKISGTREEVFKSLENMFTEAEKSGGEVSMVVTIGNAFS